MAALVVDNDSGMLAMLVFLLMLPHALCSFRSSSGMRCSASWPVCTRRTVARSSSIPAVAFARLVSLVLRLALCSLVVAGPRAGGLDQKNNYVLGWFTGVDAPRAVFLFFVVRPKMFGIMAGMSAEKLVFFWEMTSHVSVFCSLVRQWIHIYVSLQRPGFLQPLFSGFHVLCWVFAFGVQVYGILWVITSELVSVCSTPWFDCGYMSASVCEAFCLRLQKTAENPQLQFIDGRRFSCRGAQVDSHVLLFSRPWCFPHLHFLYEVIDVPGMQVVQVRRCVQRHVPSTLAVHQQGRHLPLRGAEADSHGPDCSSDHR